MPSVGSYFTTSLSLLFLLLVILFLCGRPLLEAQYVIIMKKKILLSSILVFFSLTCIVVFSTIAIKEKARKEAMESTFFRNLKIVWNDEIRILFGDNEST